MEIMGYVMYGLLGIFEIIALILAGILLIFKIKGIKDVSVALTSKGLEFNATYEDSKKQDY